MEQPDLFAVDDDLPAIGPLAGKLEPPAPPAPEASRAPDGDLQHELTAREAECNELAWLVATIGSAANGTLKPFHPYKGKPLAPVEEVLRLQRVIELMKDGRDFVTAKSTAAQEIPIKYRSMA